MSPFVRGGRSVKIRLQKVKKVKTTKYTCPRCGKKAVKRLATGIWQCKSCGVTFAGGAYMPSTPVGETVARIVGR